jgi:hypothetical protein
VRERERERERVSIVSAFVLSRNEDPTIAPLRLLLLLQSARSLWCRDRGHSGVDWTGLAPFRTKPTLSSNMPTHIHQRSFGFIHFPIPGRTFLKIIKFVPKLSVYYLFLIVVLFHPLLLPTFIHFPSVSSTFYFLGGHFF